ncbi:DUF4129 domain-containing protein [Actinotalea sp. M2MS4P-6]|uniref:DUF4129 domain-containing protein n=1 Tax=Actinotalea sp. M2MS4P-6 TaxID=2983762 RepID=UPI0021E44AA1|nr:DUF4129 domain-containing protein [Actinotalea sp. M2MS4P-6]MCV2392912.1 DUF4129 domain-containing protein [Actinotalea sp. M2MS4P-6]
MSSEGHRRPITARAAVVLGLLLLAVTASALAGPWSLEPGISGGSAGLSPAPASPTPTASPTESAAETGVEASRLAHLDLRPVVWLLLVAAIGLAAWVARTILDRRGDEPDVDEAVGGFDVEPDEPSISALRDGLAEAAEHLRREGEPADAVIAAWVALEAAAGRSGVHRDPAATPTEFVLEVLDRTPADRRAARSLLGRYERARFSGRPVSLEDVDGAAADLRALAATLRGQAVPEQSGRHEEPGP